MLYIYSDSFGLKEFNVMDSHVYKLIYESTSTVYYRRLPEHWYKTYGRNTKIAWKKLSIESLPKLLKLATLLQNIPL